MEPYSCAVQCHINVTLYFTFIGKLGYLNFRVASSPPPGNTIEKNCLSCFWKITPISCAMTAQCHVNVTLHFAFLGKLRYNHFPDRVWGRPSEKSIALGKIGLYVRAILGWLLENAPFKELSIIIIRSLNGFQFRVDHF